MITRTQHYNGMFLHEGVGPAKAKFLLRKHKEGRAYITCLNGQDLFIKKNGKVRASTMKEWKEYHRERAKGF